VGNYRIPEIPEIEQAYRAAHRALEAIMPESFGFLPEADLYDSQVLSQFPLLVDEAALVVAAHLGPYIAWQAEPVSGTWTSSRRGLTWTTTASSTSGRRWMSWQPKPTMATARLGRRQRSTGAMPAGTWRRSWRESGS
jgi:hypothetical protein